jgi:hypothetical protein
MVYENENTPAAQQEHAHDAYMTGATGLPVQTDLNEKVAVANAAHDEVSNSELWGGGDYNVVETVHPWGTVKTYAGGNIVAYADATPMTFVENLVRTQMAADELHSTGFGNADPVKDGAPTEYLDPLVLIEASKIIGSKVF